MRSLKTFGYSMAALGFITAGVVGYCLLSKESKHKADKFISSVIQDVKQPNKKININANK